MDTQSPAITKLTDEQRLDWLRLIRSDNVGPRTRFSRRDDNI